MRHTLEFIRYKADSWRDLAEDQDINNNATEGMRAYTSKQAASYNDLYAKWAIKWERHVTAVKRTRFRLDVIDLGIVAGALDGYEGMGWEDDGSSDKDEAGASLLVRYLHCAHFKPLLTRWSSQF
jgi:hypothetical protein